MKRLELLPTLVAPITSPPRRPVLRLIPSCPSAGTVGEPLQHSDLAQACLWSLRHQEWMDDQCALRERTDERFDAEADKDDAVWRRALTEPSRNLGDLVAKSRLLLENVERHLHLFLDETKNPEPDAQEKMILVVLKEVIALCA